MPLSPCSQIRGGRGRSQVLFGTGGIGAIQVQSAIGCMCLEHRRETSDTERSGRMVSGSGRKKRGGGGEWPDLESLTPKGQADG